MSRNAVLFVLMCTSVLYTFVSCASYVQRGARQKEKLIDVLKASEVFDLLSGRLDGLEEKPYAEDNEVERKEFKKLLKSIDEFLKKTDQKSKSGKQVNENWKEPLMGQSSIVCDPNPCLSGVRCVVKPGENDYQCAQCPPPMSGKNCKYILCGRSKKCFRLKDMVYAVFETNRTWAQSKQKCASEGMSLAVMKDKEAVDFVTNKLSLLYGQGKSSFFEVGLKYDPQAQRWRWTDGSALGHHIGGDFEGGAGPQCGTLHLNGDKSVWASKDCKDELYAICEKRIIIR